MMSTFDQVKDLTWEYAGKHIKSKDDITMEANLVFDLGLDSLDKIGLCNDCEDHFGGQITDEDAAELNTVGDIVRYVDNRK